jgi:antitoxin (DNA-binding transcriptional repressor) of toxin-antitoxin stability system
MILRIYGDSVKTITTTELARNLRQVIDRLAVEGEEIVIERNRRQVARLVPGLHHQTALEAMADLYRTLPAEAAADWEKDIRTPPNDQMLDRLNRDPWAS